ncbi:MAG: hypothetical protein Q7S31_00555 [bacterium]|nr:hypothetical protein [bacterium]
MKPLITAAVVSVLGLVVGWLGITYGIVQPWWPLSLSGEPEVIVTGVLATNPAGFPTGLIIQNPGQTTFIDLSRMSLGTATAYLDEQVSARGQMIHSDIGDYLLVSWLK